MKTQRTEKEICEAIIKRLLPEMIKLENDRLLNLSDDEKELLTSDGILEIAHRMRQLFLLKEEIKFLKGLL